jgi:hypothetical protein
MDWRNQQERKIHLHWMRTLHPADNPVPAAGKGAETRWANPQYKCKVFNTDWLLRNFLDVQSVNNSTFSQGAI